MIRRNLFRTFALGLCMSALFAGRIDLGTAYAQSGGGASSTQGATTSTEDNILFDLQKVMDQYLFIDHIEEIEKMGFTIIYTGVSDQYVEVGISPFSEEYAAYLYNIFGGELVKVVDTEEVIPYEQEAPDAMPTEAVNIEDSASITIDMGDDTTISDGSIDEDMVKKQLMADEEERLSIQIESIEDDEQTEDMDPELMWQTGFAEDIPVADISVTDMAVADMAEESSEDNTEVMLESAEDEMVKTASAGDIENEYKGLPTTSLIAIVAGGITVIGGRAYLSSRKKTEKKN